MKTTRNGRRDLGLFAVIIFLAAASDGMAWPHGDYVGSGRFGNFQRSNWSSRGNYSGFGQRGFGRSYGYNPFRSGYASSRNSYSPFSYFGRSDWSRFSQFPGGYGLPYLPGYGYQTYSSAAPLDDSGYYLQKLYVYQRPDYGDDVEMGMKVAAWHHLAEGATSEASGIFAAMERQLPGKGWPKIGAGLIAGFNGNYSKAQYNFQRGFRFDPEGPGDLPEEPALREKLTIMVEHYRDIVSRSKKNEEAEFMLAASAYLAGDLPTARTAIEQAIAHGDDSRGSRNLKTLVDQAGTRLAQADE